MINFLYSLVILPAILMRSRSFAGDLRRLGNEHGEGGDPDSRGQLWRHSRHQFLHGALPAHPLALRHFQCENFVFETRSKKWKSNFSDLISAFHAAWTQEAMHFWGSCQSRSFERNHILARVYLFEKLIKNKALIFMLFSQACKVTSNSNFKFPEK